MQEKKAGATLAGELKILKREVQPESMSLPEISWREAATKHRGEDLMKNLAVAAALVVCVAALQSGAVPPLDSTADAVLTAVTGDSLLDEELGKLSFVSTLFPEATLVFGEQHQDTLVMPVSASALVHTWNKSEPYVAWRTGDSTVKAALDGEVTGVYHTNSGERVVQVLGENDLVCLYGNIAECSVSVGDRVVAGDVIGTLIYGADCVLEVQTSRGSVDPLSLMGGGL